MNAVDRQKDLERQVEEVMRRTGDDEELRYGVLVYIERRKIQAMEVTIDDIELSFISSLTEAKVSVATEAEVTAAAADRLLKKLRWQVCWRSWC
jgi:hypothetical protein